jgi:amino acid transporter
MVPLIEMRAKETIAPLVMQRLLGDASSVAVTAIIAISALGASHAAVLTGARITFAQARDGLLFSSLARIHPRFQTPHISLCSSSSCPSSPSGTPCSSARSTNPDGSRHSTTFARLADGFTFTMWIFYGLAALSIFILRKAPPDAHRPFRCPGYPVIPRSSLPLPCPLLL